MGALNAVRGFVVLAALVCGSARADVLTFGPGCPLSGCAITGNLSVSGTLGLTGNIVPTTDITLLMASGKFFAIGSSGNSGPAYVFNGAAATVTGRWNFTPGTANSPLLVTTNSSTNAQQSFGFMLPGQASQFIVSLPNISGAYVAQTSNSANCGGAPGAFLICTGSDTVALGYVTGGQAMKKLAVSAQFGGTGTTGGRVFSEFDLILTAATSDTQNANWEAARINGEIRGSAGGTSGNYLGSLFALGLYARAESGATNILEVAGSEFGMSIETGASAAKLHGHSVVLLAANAVAPFYEATGYAVSGQPGTTATIRCAFCVGRFDGVNALEADAAILDILPNTYTGAGPTIANGIDLRLGTFTSAAFATSGASLVGSTLRLGRNFFTDSATGLTISSKGSVGSSAVVAAGGSGFVGTGVPLNADDGYGGLWQMTVSGGAVTGIAMLSAPYTAGAPPANPVALTPKAGQPGTGATINITWATGGNVFLATTGALATNATTGFPVLPTSAGAPTGSSTAGAIEIDTTNHKICWNEGTTTWKCALGS